MTLTRLAAGCVTAVAVGALVAGTPAAQQRVNPHSNTARGGADVRQVPGKKIGTVTTRGNIVHLELDAGAAADHNLFDLDKRTIRFTPAPGSP